MVSTVGFFIDYARSPTIFLLGSLIISLGVAFPAGMLSSLIGESSPYLPTLL
jgi:hypothetical protein